MKRSQPTLDELFDGQIQILLTTLRPQTVKQYRACARSFLTYLHARFPNLRKLSQLRRNPHLPAWFRFLCQHDPPLCNLVREARLVQLRRMVARLGRPRASPRARPHSSPGLPPTRPLSATTASSAGRSTTAAATPSH